MNRILKYLVSWHGRADGTLRCRSQWHNLHKKKSYLKIPYELLQIILSLKEDYKKILTFKILQYYKSSKLLTFSSRISIFQSDKSVIGGDILSATRPAIRRWTSAWHLVAFKIKSGISYVSWVAVVSLIASLNALVSRDPTACEPLVGVKCIRLLVSGYCTKGVGIDMSYLFCSVHSTILKVDFLRALTWCLVKLR